ncbi:putative E3 ubiquitin-protein ligase dtx2 [Mortierella sp. AM989]|nr:putative E3 ubiquitin-protein ligase dtx2 [Mortierella sp. AM989]
MPLVQSCRAEFTDLFQKFFENCSPDLEKKGLPFVRPPGSIANTNLNGQDQRGSTQMLDISPNEETGLFNTIAGDFLGHTRDKTDYQVQSIRLLRNPVLWKRYHAEKQLRRQLAQQERASREQARATAQTPPNTAASTNAATYPVEEEDPEQLFRDEILYHGTSKDRVSSILLNGLDPKMTVRANYGKGVYFSDSIEKCMQYVDKQTSLYQEYSIVLCCILLGRVLVEPHEKAKRTLGHHTMFLPEGYDSAVAHDVFKEWIIFEKSQILPLCVINFTASNDPTSFFRLSAHQVLFRGLNTTNIGDIQKVCIVPTPFDYNSPKEVLKSQEWRDPDEETATMLSNAFNIPSNMAKICNIQYGSSKDWVVLSTVSNHMCHIIDSSMATLLHQSKNIELLKDRLKSQKQWLLKTRDIQRRYIASEIQKIPNGTKLMELLDVVEPALKQINDKGMEITMTVEQMKSQLVQSGRENMINSHDFQLELRPYAQQFESLKAQYHSTYATLKAWKKEDIGVGQHIFKHQQGFLKQLNEDKDSEQRQLDAIKTETERLNTGARSVIRLVDLEELKRLFAVAKERREAPPFGGHPSGLRTKDVEVQVSTVKVWPQIVAEMLMPVLMINQIKHPHLGLLNDVGLLTRTPHIREAGVHDTSEWWHIPPYSIFGAPAATSLFWPIDPRRRLPNRRLYYFQDYLDWMFMEKENRTRKRQLRLNRLGSQSDTILPPLDTLNPTEISRLVQDQRDRLDTTIIRPIQGLTSRFGTVIFDRKERQKELDQMGVDLLNELFVEAQPHMLIREEAKAGSSKLEAAECPICQDALELPETSNTTATATVTTAASAPEKVVKLKSCRHCFHELCINEWFKSKDAQLKCPMCNTMCTTDAKSGATKKVLSGQKPQKLGPMPDGVMGYSFDVRLACYFIYIIIPSHKIPNPHSTGSHDDTITINTDIRHAILPFSARLGPLLMIRLISLFYYGHMFRVGESLTRGSDNVVVWNGVHLRTSMTGEYGFPAHNFESNCWQEINQKGIAMGLEELVLNMPRPDGSDPTFTNNDTQQYGGVALPAELLEEMAAQGMVTRLFDRNQPSLFASAP